jgi:hypothetical protein
MMSLRWMALGVVAAIAPLTTLPLTQSVQAQQSCTPLQVVDGQGTSVKKSVSPPSTGITRDNWNTDFVVPSTQNFSRYVATVRADKSGDYDLKLAFKYNNDTSDEVLNRPGYNLTANRAVSFTGTPRENSNPYQVNVSVGGVRVLGNSYTVTVQGCR